MQKLLNGLMRKFNKENIFYFLLKLQLLKEVFTKLISFEYWWYFDTHLVIFVFNDIADRDSATELRFGTELILIRENVFVIKKVEKPYLNNLIKNPVDRAVYTYNSITETLDLVLWS